MKKPDIKFEGTKVVAKYSDEFALDPNGDGQAVVRLKTSNEMEIDLLEVPDEVMDLVNKAKGK